MTHKEALTLALDFVEDVYLGEWRGPTERQEEVITAIKEALSQPEQEPVAHFGSSYVNENGVHVTTVLGPVAIPQDAKLYTTPPQRQPLTDEMVVAAARVLNERQADACGVDRDDQWAIYSDDFKADALAMLKAAHGIKREA